MAEITFTEYTSCRRENTVTFDDKELKEKLRQKVKESYSQDELKEYALEYLSDIKWDCLSNSEIIDEETDDWEFNLDADNYVCELVYDVASNLGDM